MLDKGDIKLKNKTYDNIRDIVINKTRYRTNTRNNSKIKHIQKM